MVLDKFNLNKKVCIITGGAGLLGQQYANAVLQASGTPVLIDINQDSLNVVVELLLKKYGKEILAIKTDITNKKDLEFASNRILEKYNRVDILINNAARNPKVEGDHKKWTRFENFSDEAWSADMDVGLKGAFLCSQIFGTIMAENKSGVILNISSDLGIIAPDQRIYLKNNLTEKEQMVKPVSYSVVKHGLIGLTRYLATYWADKSVRVNAICPGGVYNNQDEEFIKKLTNLIPMGRMAEIDEYSAAVLFLISDASSYMTGSVLTIDGGRTCW